MTLMPELISRADARAAGLKHYFTGVPCPREHVALRFVSIGTCLACGRERAMEKHVHTTDRRRAYSDGPGFVQAARELHGDTYLYDAAAYHGAHAPLPIVCSVHGAFMQSPTNHMQGKGCPRCAALKMGQSATKKLVDFLLDAERAWGNWFDYTETRYVSARVPVLIRCRKHDVVFQQTPTNHLSGKVGCTRCNHMKSAGEEAVRAFLSTFVLTEQRNRSLIAPKELDIWMPERQLAVEYCGAYFHSAGSAAEERTLKRKHIEKYLACRSKGIRLITLYDVDWDARKGAIRRLLRNAVGKTRGRLMARKCELRDVPIKEARAFYDRYHPQGGAGNGSHYGLYWRDKLVACMRFTFGANDRGSAASGRAWTLTRYATRITVAGAASRLFKAFVREHNPQEVKSFSDNRFFDGGMYAQLGFVLEGESPPDYQVWSPKLGLRPKPHYQRRVLAARLQEHGVSEPFDPDTDARSEAEMTYLMGARRIYDCGKKRWLWRCS